VQYRDPASLHLLKLAEYLRELADYADRVILAHTAWRDRLPQKGRLPGGCDTCRKRRWRADQRRRKALRAAQD